MAPDCEFCVVWFALKRSVLHHTGAKRVSRQFFVRINVLPDFLYDAEMMRSAETDSLVFHQVDMRVWQYRE